MWTLETKNNNTKKVSLAHPSRSPFWCGCSSCRKARKIYCLGCFCMVKCTKAQILVQSNALQAPGWTMAHQGLLGWEELQINTALCATTCRDRACGKKTLGKDLWRDGMSAESASGDTHHSGWFSSVKEQHPSGKLVAAGGVRKLLHWDVADESSS